MKIRSLLKEATFSKFEDFEDALLKAKETNNFNEFERIITDSLKKKQYEWFGRFYLGQDRSKSLSKALFKEVSPF